MKDGKEAEGWKAARCCKGCRYWKLLSAPGGGYACHYLLMTGRRSGRTGERCSTRKTRQKGRNAGC